MKKRQAAPIVAPLPAAPVAPSRRAPAPSETGDDPCFACGQPGSTCPDCGAVLCATCMKHPYLVVGHEPAEHVADDPIHVLPPPMVRERDRPPREKPPGAV